MFNIIFRVSSLLFAFVAIAELASAQTENVGIGTITPHPAALLHLESPESPNFPKGVLLPKLNTLQRNALEAQYGGDLPDGLLIYEEDNSEFSYYIKYDPIPVNPPFGEWVELSTMAQNTNTVFPEGGIIMWSGTIASIPVGWALCDGSNATPDLTDRFLISVASSAENPEPSEINTPNDYVNIDVSDGNNRRFYKIAYIIKLP